MSEPGPAKIADGDAGWVYVSRATGVKGRERIRLSRSPDGGPADLTLGPKGALELVGHLSEFIYQRRPRQ